MSKKSNRQAAGICPTCGQDRPANGPNQGRKVGSTQIAVMDLQAEAVRLAAAGKSTAAIARQLGRSERTIERWIASARVALLTEKKEHFNNRIVLHLDNTLDGLAASADLLSDRAFLETADPKRIDTIARGFGILSDKCMVLLVGARKLASGGTEGR